MNRKKYLKSTDPEMMRNIEASMRFFKQMRDDGLIPTELIPIDIRFRASAIQMVKFSLVLGTVMFLAKTADQTLESIFGERLDSWMKALKARSAKLDEDRRKGREESSPPARKGKQS